ncbi:hypothetical protein GCM10025867_50090 (plasmid) [Frondihabitans sucicola]|uniref:Transmembrane protein n=1 Tax=Frondihabitans sucicola TaxID=1268041 RepID=A0ABN6Y6F9_9MICO|nr:hypothetical protein [Frondihabitans sucicola]BDZ52768.1 hypothetical protein GCM10025867_50090 [Frondihabitans sucicola]
MDNLAPLHLAGHIIAIAGGAAAALALLLVLAAVMNASFHIAPSLLAPRSSAQPSTESPTREDGQVARARHFAFRVGFVGVALVVLGLLIATNCFGALDMIVKALPSVE